MSARYTDSFETLQLSVLVDRQTTTGLKPGFNSLLRRFVIHEIRKASFWQNQVHMYIFLTMSVDRIMTHNPNIWAH